MGKELSHVQFRSLQDQLHGANLLRLSRHRDQQPLRGQPSREDARPGRMAGLPRLLVGQRHRLHAVRPRPARARERIKRQDVKSSKPPRPAGAAFHFKMNDWDNCPDSVDNLIWHEQNEPELNSRQIT